jgi:4-hydroxy-4-methyl-2-oxoglutarate aldolase
MSAEQDIVARLRAIDCCALSDALDQLGLAGCVTGLAALSAPRRIAGRVHTVKLVAKALVPPTTAPPRHLGTTAIEASGPGDILVIEQKSGIDAGSWGGILSLGAKLRGVEGVIADGPVRDIGEARDLDFPIYARGTTARTARGRIGEMATDVPVTIGDVSVAPGDYAVADSDAAIFIRHQDVMRVLAAAESIAQREAAMARSLREGKSISEVMGASYERMLEK